MGFLYYTDRSVERSEEGNPLLESKRRDAPLFLRNDRRLLNTHLV